MRTSRISAIAALVVASLAIAACGSSSSSSSTSGGGVSSSSGSSSGERRRTLNGAGSTLAAPIYQQWGSNLKAQGLTVNYNPVGSGTGITDLQTATVDFAGDDPALKPADIKGMKGPVLPVPGRVRRDHRVLQPARGQERAEARRSGGRRHLRGQDQDLERPGDQVAQPRHEPAEHGDHGRAPLGLVGHHRRLHDVPGGRQPELEVVDRRRQGRQVAGRHRRAGNSGVAAAVKQTTGAVGYVEQAYALENGFTYAAVKNSSGNYVLPTICEHVGGGGRGQGLAEPRHVDDQLARRPRATRSRRRRSSITYQDPCKSGGASSGTASGVEVSS